MSKYTIEKAKSDMLFVMQWGHRNGIIGALQEFNTIFRRHPEWQLTKWEVFRAWYKSEIDHMLKYPDTFKMTLDNGVPYTTAQDPLYDPEAPDWEQFDRMNYDDDETMDNLHGAADDNSTDFSEAAKKGLYTGIGFAIGNSIVGGGN